MLKSHRSDAFPTTPRSWICTQIQRGPDGLAAANKHIMAGYAQPLRIYLLGSSFRALGDPDELINDFFANRLGRSDFLAKWEASQRPMRYWLLVGFRYYLMEQLAKRQQHDSTQANLADLDRASDPAHAFHREVARSLVREAAQQAESACQHDGLSEHWSLWIRHHLEGRSMKALAAESGHDLVRVKVMMRTAGNRFRRALRELLRWPGATREHLDHEIRELVNNLAGVSS